MIIKAWKALALSTLASFTLLGCSFHKPIVSSNTSNTASSNTSSTVEINTGGGDIAINTGGTTTVLKDLSGNYNIASASDIQGRPYRGAVKINRTGESYQISWSIPGNQSYTGFGIPVGDVLGVGWGVGGRFGVAVYEINGGVLRGKWTGSGLNGAVGIEVLQGPDGLNGTYKITESRSVPNGNPYTGSVIITPNGDTYTVMWNLANESYSGIGVRQGDVLVVGWGIGSRSVGVVGYTVVGNWLNGKWANPGGTKTGTEKLLKN